MERGAYHEHGGRDQRIWLPSIWRILRVAGICWLASYPKSGNTWLRAFLANLFSGPGLPDRPVPINELNRYSLADDFYSRYQDAAGGKAEMLTEEELLRLHPKMHETFATASDDTVFVKTHNAFIAVNDIPLITPTATAGAIYVVRNPLDVAVSYASHFQIPLDLAVQQLCDPSNSLPPSDGLMRRYLGSWSGHLRSWTRVPCLRLQLVRFEDMARRPLQAFGSVVSFLGLPEEPARIERAVQFSSFDELRKQEEESGFEEARPDGAARFFRQGIVGAGRETLTEEQAARLIEVHQEVMIELGYLDRNGKLTF